LRCLQNILGLGQIVDANGMNLGALLALSAITGFAGAMDRDATTRGL
jgi:hypothetical protein